MPITSRSLAWSGPPTPYRCPIAEPFGNIVRAIVSLITVTLRGRRILWSKGAARQQRNSHCRKVAGGHNVVLDVAIPVRVIAVHGNSRIPATLVIGEQGATSCVHTRKRTHALLDLLIQAQEARIAIRVADGTRVGLKTKYVLLAEASVDVGQIDETSTEESGG